MNLRQQILLVAITLVMASCSSQKSMPAVDYVDLERFMGDWYVIANIPTFLEKDAYNPVESYRLDSDGSVATPLALMLEVLVVRKKSIIRVGLSQIQPAMRYGECSLYGRSRLTIELSTWMMLISKPLLAAPVAIMCGLWLGQRKFLIKTIAI